MLLLLFVGGILEKLTGRVKYLIIYFGSGIIAGICSMGYNMVREYGLVPYGKTTVSVGASGAIFGVVGAILFIVIINRGRLEQISFRQLMLFIILSLYNGVANAQIVQTAHIGGFIAGLLLAAVFYRRKKAIDV
jgi:rhomboid protease GluP